MVSMVQDLMKDALDSSVSPVNFLLKTLAVARKLKVKDLEIWVNSELDGYNGSENIPMYRKVACQIQMQNPYHGWQAIIFSREIAQNLNTAYMNQSISELE